MTAFADSSVLVKLYADEPGSGQVRRQPVLVVSAISRVEVTAALWRKHRMGDLTAEDVRILVDAFLADWANSGDGPGLVPIRVGPDVLDQAVRLCGIHGLRAYDSVQLGSAVLARQADAGIDRFLAADRSLQRAAAVEGFTVSE